MAFDTGGKFIEILKLVYFQTFYLNKLLSLKTLFFKWNLQPVSIFSQRSHKDNIIFYFIFTMHFIRDFSNLFINFCFSFYIILQPVASTIGIVTVKVNESIQLNEYEDVLQKWLFPNWDMLCAFWLYYMPNLCYFLLCFCRFYKLFLRCI